MNVPLLSIENLSVSFEPMVAAVRSLSLVLHAGERLGLLGESGSGKSITARAIVGLLPDEAISHGSICWPALSSPPVAGRDVGIVFQDPLSSLNPVLTIGEQIGEVLSTHRVVPVDQVPARAIALLERVGIAQAHARVRAYPHEFSGGQRQRIAIAIAIAAAPRLLIADEPTSALDSVVQAQVMALLDTLTRDAGMALLLITHDMALASRSVDRIAVLYAGRLVEVGAVAAVLGRPRHPYTRALLASHLDIGRPRGERLPEIAGTPPAPGEISGGCPFASRCSQVQPNCRERFPDWTGDVHDGVACWQAGAA